MKQFFSYCAILATFVLFIYSCKPTSIEVTNPFDFVEVINAYGPQNLSKLENIFIDFKSEALGNFNPETLTAAFTISPKADGEIFVENEHILVFNPTSKLQSNTEYVVRVNLSKFIDTKFKLKNNEFSFKVNTIPQSGTLDFRDLYLVNDQWNAVVSLHLNDKEDLADIERALKITQNGRPLSYRLAPETASKIDIIISELDMDLADSKLNVSVARNPLGLEKDLNLVFQFPAPSSFSLVRTISDQSKMTFVFNKILDENQNLNGLINLDPESKTPQYKIDGNRLIIFNENGLLEGKSIALSDKIKDKAGMKLSEMIIHKMGQATLKPKLKNVGIGHILPGSDKVIFPFEAQGLKSVHVEIFKVYADNLQQFYQTNTSSNYYNLDYVGENVFSQDVKLDELGVTFNPRQMNRYHFDLKSFIAEEKNALYDVRIGFSPADIVLECPDMEYNLDVIEGSFFDQNYYGLFGYYDGYKWKDRDSPCKLAYYNSDKFISKMIMTSNLGIIAKTTTNGDLFVAVNDIITSLPISGAEIRVFNKAQRLLVQSTTDSKGMFLANDMETAYQIQVIKNTDENWIKVEPNDALSLSKFDVSGRSREKGLDGMIYSERNIWRPGDSMFIDFILFDTEGKLPKDHPVKLIVKDAQGKLVYTERSLIHNGPIYPFVIPTKRDFVTGDYVVTAFVGAIRFSKFFKLENIKPNKFAIQSTLETVDLEDYRTAILGAGKKFDFQVDWLYGAPAKDKKLTVQLDINDANTTFEAYKEYKFTDPRNNWYSPEPLLLSESRTNKEGNASVNLKLNSDVKPKGKLSLRFKNTAYEDSGDFSADVFSVPFSPYKNYVGVRMPRDDYDYKRTSIDKETKIQLVSVSGSGNVSNADISVKIYKMENYWWYNSYNNDFDMTNLRAHISQSEWNLNTGNDGEASINTTFRSNGRYYIQVCDKQSGHCTGDYLYVGYAWDDNEMSTDQYEEAAQLSLKTEKSSFAMNETVEVLVPSYFEGRALVSLENGDKIVQSFWTKVQRGNNKITFTPQIEMFPTVYVHVTLLQEFASKANDMPIRLYGVLPITIEDVSLKLQPVISTKDELKPKEKFEITISEKEGKEMYYTIALVDEGLLNISRFKTPDPFAHFYSRPSLGVRTFDNYNDIMSAYGSDLSGLFSIGGDAENIVVDDDARANRFRPVVQHLGPFFVGSGAQRKHSISMPNYIGSVRLMVVAANKSSFGSSDKNIPVKQDLMVMATLPRSLAIGDEVDLPITIFGLKDKLGEVSFGVETSSNLLNFSNKSGVTNFSFAEEKLERLKAKAKLIEGVEKIGFYAKNAQITSTQEIEIDIANPNPVVRRSEQKFLEAGSSFEFALQPIGKSKGLVITSASSLFPINIENQIDRLTRYPYGCLEQRTSAAIAMLYSSKLTEQTEPEKALAKAVVVDLLNDLYRFENIQGYSLWPGSPHYNDWLTNYIGDFMFQAQEQGFSIPTTALDHWKSSQINRASNWSIDKSNLERYQHSMMMTQAYRLYTLSQIGNPQFSEMNRLREDHKLDANSTVLLCAAYALAGRQDIAGDIIRSYSGFQVSDDLYNANTYGSDERNAALQVIMLHALGDKEKIAKSVKVFNDILAANNYMSTQSTAFVLRAMSLVAENFGTSKDISISYSDGSSSEKVLSSATGNVSVQSELTSDKTIKLENKSTQGIFVEIVRVGKEDINTSKSVNSQLKITTEYIDLAGNAIDPTKVQQGNDFRVVTRVSRPKVKENLYNDLVLRQIFPAGWEITNNRIFDFGQQTNSKVDYQDYKDNQVNSFFSLRNDEQITIETLVKATYVGKFHHPKMISESMYHNDIYAEMGGFTTTVLPQ